jgi:hypothetical protein
LRGVEYNDLGDPVLFHRILGARVIAVVALNIAKLPELLGRKTLM